MREAPPDAVTAATPRLPAIQYSQSRITCPPWRRGVNCGDRSRIGNRISGTAPGNPLSSRQSYPAKPPLEFLHRFAGGLFGPWQVGEGSAVHALPAASHFMTVPAATQR